MIHVLVGGGLGALVGAVASVGSDLVRGKPVSWKRAGAAALGGAVAGAIGAATFGTGFLATGAVAKAGGMVLAGASGGAIERTTDNLLHDRPWHEDVARDASIGAALGGVGAAGRALGPVLRRGGGVVARTAQRGWGRYLTALDRRPLLTKGATSGVIAGGGDLIAQKIEGRRTIDWKRTAFMTGLGALWGGPSAHAWYKWVGKLIPGNTLKALAAKIALDQVLLSPVDTVVVFSATGLFKGESWREILERNKRDLWPAMKSNFLVWPAAVGVNFRYVPQRLQVLFSNGVNLGWSSYLSWMGHHDRAAETAPADGLPLDLASDPEPRPARDADASPERDADASPERGADASPARDATGSTPEGTPGLPLDGLPTRTGLRQALAEVGQ